MSNDYYDYCVFDDTPVCRDLNPENWKITKKPRGKYHLQINDNYEDPDIQSEKLYTIAADEFNSQAEKFGIKIGFKAEKFYLCAKYEYDNKSNDIDLSGDWIISWNDLYKLFRENDYTKQEMTEIIRHVHTVRWHTFWPCRRYYNGTIFEPTVNMARGSHTTMYETLRRLGDCYTKNFEDVCWEGQKSRALERAFCRNGDWFRLFGDINGYKNFWNLNFIEKDVVKMIENEISSNF